MSQPKELFNLNFQYCSNVTQCVLAPSALASGKKGINFIAWTFPKKGLRNLRETTARLLSRGLLAKFAFFFFFFPETWEMACQQGWCFVCSLWFDSRCISARLQPCKVDENVTTRHGCLLFRRHAEDSQDMTLSSLSSRRNFLL